MSTAVETAMLGARRMAQSAAVLVDEVIPRVPVRQWVLSFPIGLRILFAARPELLKRAFNLDLEHALGSGIAIIVNY